jgi:hypothetical protein
VSDFFLAYFYPIRFAAKSIAMASQPGDEAIKGGAIHPLALEAQSQSASHDWVPGSLGPEPWLRTSSTSAEIACR